ncbi:MAG: hypothetical protein E7588_04275 [Ruminococcaceae bacterium]|nr:hypothetical protein [Oscillospiraceae bacterium]
MIIVNSYLDKFEDKVRLSKQNNNTRNQTSPYCDFIYYSSTRTPGITLAMRILKPEKPSYILAGTHGWHMSIPAFEHMDKPQSKYLTVEVDMRGRAFSEGEQDCNGWELYDVIDAIEYVKKHYAEYITDPETVYFEAGSGGGGNALAIAGKFPDYFAAVTAMCGMSDYGTWYKNDQVGEFRDEMDVWISKNPTDEMFASRSGIATLKNLFTHMTLVHGANDIRVPAYHSRNYVKRAEELGKKELVRYLEFETVGGRDHWDNMTPEQLKQMEAFCESDREANRKPTEIPQKGTLVVAGYLFTKHFSVVMNDINRVTTVDYDLEKGIFNVNADSDSYTLSVYKN